MPFVCVVFAGVTSRYACGHVTKELLSSVLMSSDGNTSLWNSGVFASLAG